MFPLLPNSKIPLPGTHSHLDAVPVAAFEYDGGNYGISLEGFVVVDFDREDKDGWKTRLAGTWHQKTRRGEHFVFRVPANFTAKNCKFPAGDIKFRGYIVGPGSVVAGVSYVCDDSRDPEPAPQWLLDYVVEQSKVPTAEDGEHLPAITQDKGRNDSLTALGGLLRRQGLGEDAIAKGLVALNKSIVEPPLPLSEIKHIARSVSHYEASQETGPLVPDGWLSAADMSLVTPLVSWWEYGFVPKKQLVMVYAKGGTGKSTLGSWLAAKVTKAGGRFAVAAIEESFELFALRAVLDGGDKERILRIPNPSAVHFPRDASALAEAIRATRTDFVFFDAIFSHFEDKSGLNSAERARGALGPLAEVAQETGCTIMGVFHENKAETYLGSVEMLNVARTVLHLTRQEGKPMYARVVKTNYKHPHKYLRFDGEEMAASDPNTGDLQMEEDEKGTIRPATVFVIRSASRQDQVEEFVDVDALEPSAEEAVRAYYQSHPNVSVRDAASDLGMSKTTVHRWK